VGNQYKDSLFRSLFSDKQTLLELYNSIKRMHYDERTETIFTHQRDDRDVSNENQGQSGLLKSFE
jgi:hypothetical protein